MVNTSRQEKCSFAINLLPVVLVVTIPVVNRLIRAERKWLEGVVVIELVNSGRMGENSPISSIAI